MASAAAAVRASLLCPRSRLKQQFASTTSGFRSVWVGEGCTGLGVELETTVDQALIRGLVTAFRAFVSGLSSV